MTHQRVLIVDDDQDFGESLAEALGLSGLNTGVATSATEALDRVNREEFGVALIDVVMPGTDGVSCLDQILSVRPDTRVGIMTGYTLPERIERAIELGAACVLQKPIDVQALVGNLSEICTAPVVILGMADATHMRRIKSELERRGFNVETAMHPDVVRARMQSGEIDLAVVDRELLAGMPSASPDQSATVPVVAFDLGEPPTDVTQANPQASDSLHVLPSGLSLREIGRAVKAFHQQYTDARKTDSS